MTLGLLRAVVWPFTALGLVALLAAAFTPVVPASAPESRAKRPRSAKESVLKDAVLDRARPSGPDTYTERSASIRMGLDSIARLITERDLFRRSRRLGPVGGLAVAPGASPTPAVPKPPLTLVGLVTGPEPSAVIEGFPGVQGPRAVRPGDVIGELTVRRITRVIVEVAGMDTVWVLTMREPWKEGR